MILKERIFETEKSDVQVPITEEVAAEAMAILEKYKRQKAAVDRRIVENEEWWKMNYAPSDSQTGRSSAWLFNSIANKHADAMDNYPSPVILPREKSDEAASRRLSAVVPCILESCYFDKVYSDVWYDKLKFGSGCYGVFWNPEKLCGLGDVDICQVDLVNLFWEGGVENIQKSANVFHVRLYANDYLEREYPMLKGVLSSPAFTQNRYHSEISSDDSEKSAVIDWYYKKKSGTKVYLHYVRICAGKVLFASENEEGFENGFYAHGLYPFFLDTMYPVKASPVGFGMIDVMKGAQMQIDRLGDAVVKNAVMSAGARYFIRSDGSVNEDEFADWSRPMVHVQGARLGDDSLRPIETASIDPSCMSVLSMKIDELKETSGNRDFSQGGTTGGITAASAIAALQEAGSKLSRDMVRTTYRVFSEIVSCVIELVREFYTEPRFFRILGDNGSFSFISYSADEIMPKKASNAFSLDLGERLPVFDVKVSAEKQSPFARASQNELAKELFKMGLFDSSRFGEAYVCISMMEFEGKEELLEKLCRMNGLENGGFGNTGVVGAVDGASGVPRGGVGGALRGGAETEKGYPSRAFGPMKAVGRAFAMKDLM